MLLLKLTLVPLFLGLISLAGQRFGPNVAGWLAGLRVMIGPILFLLALEQGTAFAQRAAVYALASVLGIIAFGVAYAWVARRSRSLLATAAGLGAWALSAALILAVPQNAYSAFAIALLTLTVATRAYPRLAAIPAAVRLPKLELALRMLAGAGLTLAVTTIAQTAGPNISGMLALFPVLTSVLAIFTHRSAGADHAIALLRGLAKGLFSLAGFCFTLTQLLDRVSLAAAFLLSVTVAIGIQYLTRLMGEKHG